MYMFESKAVADMPNATQANIHYLQGDNLFYTKGDRVYRYTYETGQIFDETVLLSRKDAINVHTYPHPIPAYLSLEFKFMKENWEKELLDQLGDIVIQRYLPIMMTNHHLYNMIIKMANHQVKGDEVWQSLNALNYNADVLKVHKIVRIHIGGWAIQQYQEDGDFSLIPIETLIRILDQTRG